MWGLVALIFYFFWHRMIGMGSAFLLLLVVMMESLLRTDYIVYGDGILSVKSGFFPRYRLLIGDIVEVKCIRSNSLAYAMSSDRLQLITPYDSRMISPENKEDFIRELRKYNHNVKVTDCSRS